MSYILDALKKSDQERSNPTIVQSTTVQPPPVATQPERKKWLWLIPALLILNILILLWPAQPAPVQEIAVSVQPPEADASPTLTAKEVEELTPATETTDSVIPDNQIATSQIYNTVEPILQPGQPRYHRDPFAPLTPSPARDLPLKDAIANPRTEAPAQPVQQLSGIQLPQPDIEQLNRNLLNQALIEQLAPLRQAETNSASRAEIPAPETAVINTAQTELPIKDRVTDLSSVPGLATQPAENTPQQIAREQNRIPLLQELDAQTRAMIPELSVSVHIYAPLPEQRMARINGAMLREGDQLSEEVVLKEIRSGSLLFTVKEKQFLLLR